jgi:hypothetical protein
MDLLFFALVHLVIVALFSAPFVGHIIDRHNQIKRRQLRRFIAVHGRSALTTTQRQNAKKYGIIRG